MTYTCSLLMRAPQICKHVLIEYYEVHISISHIPRNPPSAPYVQCDECAVFMTHRTFYDEMLLNESQQWPTQPKLAKNNNNNNNGNNNVKKLCNLSDVGKPRKSGTQQAWKSSKRSMPQTHTHTEWERNKFVVGCWSVLRFVYVSLVANASIYQRLLCDFESTSIPRSVSDGELYKTKHSFC